MSRLLATVKFQTMLWVGPLARAKVMRWMQPGLLVLILMSLVGTAAVVMAVFRLQ